MPLPPPEFWRTLAVAGAAADAAIIVLVGLAFWLWATTRSPKQPAQFRTNVRASIYAGAPAVLAFVITRFHFSLPNPRLPLGLCLYTGVYGALLLGNRLRARSTRPDAPDPTKLWFAALLLLVAASVILQEYISRGLLGADARLEVPALLLGLGGVLVFVGFHLTNPILGSSKRGGAPSPVRESPLRAKGPEEHPPAARTTFGSTSNTTQSTSDPAPQKEMSAMPPEPSTEQPKKPQAVPDPEIPTGTPSRRMLLKLKRSQRSGALGKVIFVLDARMEVPPEETALIRKYRLGDDIVYESSSRQARRDAMMAHLERSGETPRFSDGGNAQLAGAAKSLYRLARAGFSATVAALSLKVTINGLISGVHVECKSMDELLAAEEAIREAGDSVRVYLNVAATFDGREEIVEL